MYAFIEGELVYKSPSVLYVLAGGIGYEVNITLQTYTGVQALHRCRLFTHLQVREDAWVLYGFIDENERATFRQLLSINGVGAATARIILSSLTTDELARAVATDDAKTLEKVKGIGNKTAQRILLELKGKLLVNASTTAGGATMHNTIGEDALIALMNLGISKTMAEAAIKKVPNATTLTVEELIKQALRML
jgi:holliday junction DNA helicase RuvA